MTYYLFIFVLPFLMVNLLKTSKALENTFYLLFVIYLIVIVGLRFEMGLDWGNYITEYYDRNFKFSDHKNFQFFFENLLSGNIIVLRNLEPLYLLTLKISHLTFGNIILFNFLNALIAIVSLSFFCFKLQNKWLGLAILAGFVIFYGMDIVRQFSSLGLIFLAIYNLSKKNYLYSLLYWFLSICFHISSIIFFFLFLYIFFKKNKFNKNLFSLFILISILGFLFFNLENYFKIIETSSIDLYPQNFFQSKGLIFRFITCIIPLIVFLIFKNHFLKSRYFEVLNWYSLLILGFTFLIMFNFNSTIIDRLIVYTLPFQVIVFNDAIKIFNTKKIKNLYLFGVTFFYLIFSSTWLFLSEDNFRVYVPYKSVIWEDYYLSPTVICNKSLFTCQLEGQDSIKYE